MCSCCSCAPDTNCGWLLEGSQHNPPSAAFDPWAPLVNAPVLQSSCKVALAEDPPVPTARTVCPSLAWGHTEVPVALGSVPCPSLGRRGGRSAAGSKVLRHKVLLENLNISDYGEAFAFHSLKVGQITVTD